MIAITGATGQLGRMVLDELLKDLSPDKIIAAVRNIKKADDFSLKGVYVRHSDYDIPETMDKTFEGVEKLLLISSSEVGERVRQHENIISSAKKAGVKHIVYTSILHADFSPLPLSKEHKKTEDILKESKIPHTLLRNGWYTENYTAGIPNALQYGSIFGCAGEGKISSAERADYAAAAAKVLKMDNQEGKIYELAGDSFNTLDDLAKELSDQTGKEIV